MDELDEAFLVISGDVLTDIDLGAIVEFHRERKAMATIGLKSMENPLEFGIVITRDDGSVERFLEKPTWGRCSPTPSTPGSTCSNPRYSITSSRTSRSTSRPTCFPGCSMTAARCSAAITDGYWEDVGTLDAYIKAHQDVLDAQVEVDIPGFRIGEGIWLGEGSEIDPAATVTGPAIIGDYCRIEAGAQLSEYTVLGSNVRVGADSFIERSVVHDNVYLGTGVRLRGTIIGRSSDLRPRSPARGGRGHR